MEVALAHIGCDGHLHHLEERIVRAGFAHMVGTILLQHAKTKSKGRMVRFRRPHFYSFLCCCSNR